MNELRYILTANILFRAYINSVKVIMFHVYMLLIGVSVHTLCPG